MKKAKSSSTPAPVPVAAQDELLARGWPTSAEVGRANESQFDNPAQWAKNKRDAGELLGVWSPGRWESVEGVNHLIAERLHDHSLLLDTLDSRSRDFR